MNKRKIGLIIFTILMIIGYVVSISVDWIAALIMFVFCAIGATLAKLREEGYFNYGIK